MVDALEVHLADGSTIVTEAGDDACWHSEEVSAYLIGVDDDRECDICGEPIGGDRTADDDDEEEEEE